jgi:hypothetical protein
MKVVAKVLSCWLAVALVSCGGGFDEQQLELNFSPRDLPAGTTRLRHYVLRGTLSDRSEARCEDFVGPSATKKVSSYQSDVVTFGLTDVSNISGATVVIDNLQPAKYMFFLEALAGASLTGCGCGSGIIVKGEKTVIPIHIVSPCH